MAEPLIVAEEEQPVFRDGPPNGGSELIPSKRGNRALIEEVSSIQGAIAEEFKNRTVELIASGLRHNRDLRPGSLAVFGRVRSREDVEFTDRIDSQKVSAYAPGRYRELARSGVFNAVQQKDILQRPPPRDGEGIAIAGAGICAF